MLQTATKPARNPLAAIVEITHKIMTRKRKSIRFIDMLKSIRKEIKLAFLISFFSILFIEILLNGYPAPYKSFYIIGEIYLKICYSIVATSIFFLINLHIPKENRNVKTNRYISNKLVSVSNELYRLLESLHIDKQNLEITEEMIKLACAKINPESQVVELRILTFSNWQEYLKYKTDRIKNKLTDVIILNSTIETELLGHILNMLDAIDKFIFLDSKNVSYGKDLSFYSDAISYLYEENCKIGKLISNGKYLIYRNTNMNEYRNN